MPASFPNGLDAVMLHFCRHDDGLAQQTTICNAGPLRLSASRRINSTGLSALLTCVTPAFLDIRSIHSIPAGRNIMPYFIYGACVARRNG